MSTVGPFVHPSGMTIRDHMSIRLAAAHYRYPGARDADVREQVGMSAPLFHRHVLALIQRPDVLAAYPLEVRRLQRLRDRRRAARSA